MSPVRRAPHVVVAPVVALALALAACGDGSAEAIPPTTTPTTGAAPTTSVDPAPTIGDAAVDWAARTADVDAPGWEVAFCEGDAPLLCVARDASPVGVVEHLAYPVASVETLAGALDDGDATAELEAWAGEHVATFTADRAEGCGDGYEVRGDPVVSASVGGTDGIRYGFTGSVGGRVVEHAAGFAAVEGERLVLVTASGLADDGCLARESELDVEDLEAFLPHLAAIAAGSTFPPG